MASRDLETIKAGHCDLLTDMERNYDPLCPN